MFQQKNIFILGLIFCFVSACQLLISGYPIYSLIAGICGIGFILVLIVLESVSKK